MAVEKVKQFSNLNLIYLILGLLVLGFVLLISSGLFDSPEINAMNQNVNVPQSSTSVDLNKINEINQLENIVNQNPENYEALLNLGHLLNDSRFYDRAIDKYNTYLKKFPNNADVIVDLGVCYYELKKYDEAISSIEKAIKIQPDHQIAHFNLGIVNLAINNIQEAKNWWGKAVKLNPTSNIGTKAQELLNNYN